jgi:hypothetical protein
MRQHITEIIAALSDFWHWVEKELDQPILKKS